MNKHELKSLLENIYTALKEDEGDFVGPPDPTYPDFSPEDRERLTRELFPNGIPEDPVTDENSQGFTPPLWWRLGDKLWRWWQSFSQRPQDPMELNYHLIRPFWYFDVQGNPQQQPWSLPRDDPGYREEHNHDWGPLHLRPGYVAPPPITEEGEWHPPLLSPPDPYPIPMIPPIHDLSRIRDRPPPPWLSPLAPKPPVRKPKPTWGPRPQGTPEDLNTAIQWADNLIGEDGILWGPGLWQKPGWTINIGGRNLTLEEYIDWIRHTRREALQQQQEN